MKRRGNVISPVDTIDTLAEMLVGTDFTVEDGELVYVRSTQQWFVYRVDSGLVPDGVNVIQPAYGNGVWEILNIGSGIPGPPGPGLFGPLTPIAAGASAALARQAVQCVEVDASGAQNTCTFPVAPLDGDVIVVKLITAASSPVLLAPGAGTQSIENTDGTGLAPAGTSVGISDQFASAIFVYRTAVSAWRQYV